MTGNDKNNLGKKSTRIGSLRLKPPVFHFTRLLAQKTDRATLWHISACRSHTSLLLLQTCAFQLHLKNFEQYTM